MSLRRGVHIRRVTTATVSLNREVQDLEGYGMQATFFPLQMIASDLFYVSSCTILISIVTETKINACQQGGVGVLVLQLHMLYLFCGLLEDFYL